MVDAMEEQSIASQAASNFEQNLSSYDARA